MSEPPTSTVGSTTAASVSGSRAGLASIGVQLGLAWTGLMLAVFWLGPLLWTQDPQQIDLDAVLAAGTAAHPLGTDVEGRDLLARILAGGQLATLVGVGTAALAVGVGATLGALAGWRGGLVDTGISRAADVAMAFPGILLALLVIFVSERPGVLTVVLSLSLTSWASHSRMVRGLVLGLRSRDDLLAAQLYGSSGPRLLRLHVLPAIGGPLAVQATFAAASAVLGEASLSFLGLGPDGAVSWGALLEDGTLLALRSPLLLLGPASALLLWQAGLFVLADGLRDSLDPRNVASAPSGVTHRRTEQQP